MSYAVFNIGLQDHRRNKNFGVIYIIFEIYIVSELISKSFAFKIKISRYIFHFFCNTYALFSRKLKCISDKFRKSCYKFVCTFYIFIHYILLYRIETVKNEMRIHL